MQSTPPPPQPPYFDQERGAWVISRYADVTAALREPFLWPLAPQRADDSSARDDAGRLLLRPAVQEVLSGARVAEWQDRVEALARNAVRRLAEEHIVNLLGELALPWCLDVGMLVLARSNEERQHLADLGHHVFAATGEPDDSPLRPIAAEATAELERLLHSGPMPMGEPSFVAISQTTPRLLANIWVALFRHPGEVARLRTSPDLMPGAVEELLRYAGIVRRVWRRATGDVEIAGIRIAQNERALLMLASANRDPAQFYDPDRLDLTRNITSQVALGMGRNSCVGATVIRMMISVITGALLAEFPDIELSGTPEWRVGSGYCFPTSTPVHLHRTIPPVVFT